MRDVALIIPLRFFFLGRNRERDDADNTRIQRFGNPLNNPAFSGGVPPFENNDDAQPFLFDPTLKLNKLDLKPG